MAEAATRRAIEAVYRIERSKLVAGLARMLRDLDAAEELAQDAFLAALTDWPATGIPDRPGAWLVTTARRRASTSARPATRLRSALRTWRVTARLVCSSCSAAMSPPSAATASQLLDRLDWVGCRRVRSVKADMTNT